MKEEGHSANSQGKSMRRDGSEHAEDLSGEKAWVFWEWKGRCKHWVSRGMNFQGWWKQNADALQAWE